MTDDERKIRALVAEWMRASAAGETELQVLGDWAWCRTHIDVTVTPLQDGQTAKRSGYTLSIMRKKPDGVWILARDANLLTAAA